MSNKKFLKNIDLEGKLVFLRVDFNVPLNDQGEIVDATRIERSIPTIKTILKRGGRIILCSHLGRPKGKVNPKLSLKPCSSFLQDMLKEPVQFIHTLEPRLIQKQIADSTDHSIFLIENIRFLQDEENPESSSWPEAMSQFIDVYVNDAFGTSHRKHMSMHALASMVDVKTNGLLVNTECEALNKCIHEVDRPFAAVIGGAKVSTKLGLIEHLIDSVDYLLIGGGMVNTFERAHGAKLESPLVEEPILEKIPLWMERAKAKGCEVLTPIDYLVSSDLNAPLNTRFDVSPVQLSPNEMIVDIGPKTVKKYTEILSKMKTIFWNGPMGRFEVQGFEGGTRAIATAIADSEGYTVIGGGDSLAAIKQWDLTSSFSHVCTGGGASLAYIESLGHLPALDILKEKSMV